YTLVVRGAGNFSYRLYEVLCCGRIPVFVNTDCVLPYDDVIDWSRHCVWVESHELKRMSETILEFHDSISPADFEDLQRENRRLYEEWLSPTAFFGKMRRYLL
ncbi:MAG: exostosin family protein, partial [Anaerolineae bacterium]|nr:exostosin family protein [Anaerolineae bacterium]